MYELLNLFVRLKNVGRHFLRMQLLTCSFLDSTFLEKPITLHYCLRSNSDFLSILSCVTIMAKIFSKIVILAVSCLFWGKKIFRSNLNKSQEQDM